MKTKLLPDLKDCGLEPFTFAGFSFPKYVWALERGKPADRLAKLRRNAVYSAGRYYHAPRPLKGAHPGQDFYLSSAGQPFRRWLWADAVDGARIKHEGWFCDEFQDQTIRGIVVRLPHGRFLAGWSMGEGMSSYVDGAIYDDIVDVARAADSMAENAADREREYQQQEQERFEAEECQQEEEETVDSLDSEIDDYRVA